MAGAIVAVTSVLREHLVVVSLSDGRASDLQLQGLYIGRWSEKSEYRN
jgi:hypothetical protein